MTESWSRAWSSRQKSPATPKRFLLGSREVAGETDLDVYSEKSPLGAAIHGKRAGESVTYTAPNGKEISVDIISATPYAG